MIDVLNLALPYFSLIFIGFACGKAKGLPEAGLAWMNFFLLYVSLPALLYGIMSKTPFSELNNPPFLIATTCGTVTAFVLAMLVGRLLGGLSLAVFALLGLGGGAVHDWRTGPVVLVALVGFLITGPYSFLAGAISLDFGGKRGSGTASGIIDGVGYLGGVLSGDGMARIAVSHGWGGAFLVLAAVAFLSAAAAAMFLGQERRIGV